MKIDILTLFPEMFEGFKTQSIIKRAIEKEKVEINIIDIRDYTPEVTVFWFILFLITIPHLTQKTFSTILHYRPRGPPIHT